MKAPRLVSVTLFTLLLFTAEGLYSAQVVTSQKERSAHPSKPIQFQYVCPMHADVKSKRPGKCPKCKMTLEKKRITQIVE
jgi:heavy metal-binding protein